jgi:hypothetical protein
MRPSLALDSSGNVFVTGSSYGPGSDYYDYATIKYSSTGAPLWTNRYNGPGASDIAKAVAVDSSGNVFVTGYSDGSGSGIDYATIKYSSSGMPAWTNRYNGTGNSDDSASGIVVDSSGNVFVTGTSQTAADFGSADYVTIKYSGQGAPLWTNRYNGPGNNRDFASAIAVNGTENVFVTGVSQSTVDSSSRDYATIAYSGAGVPLWTNRYNGPANLEDRATALAVDGSGNVFVAGSSYGGGIGPDCATIKYSGTGVPLWTNRFEGASPAAIAVDGSGNVVVTGSSYRGGSGIDCVTIKYSGAGVLLWTNRYNGPANGDDQAYALAVDRSGNVFMTGSSRGTGTPDDYADYVTIVYSSVGVPLWINRYSGPGNGSDEAHAVAVDINGDVVITGSSYGNGSANDYTTIKYSSSIVLVIRSQPASQIVCLGSNVTFSVSAESPSPPISYQWQFGGQNVAGETNSTLVIENAQAVNAGDYRVIVSDRQRSLVSDIAQLMVSTAPTIIQQPQSQTVRSGSNATFSVSVYQSATPFRLFAIAGSLTERT